MVYTEYIAKLLSTQGVPRMTPDQFKIILNIIHLEGRINEFEKLKRSRLFMDKREVGMHQMHLQSHLMQLTQLEAPHRLVEMILKNPQE
jgi:hypothetical protein